MSDGVPKDTKGFAGYLCKNMSTIFKIHLMWCIYVKMLVLANKT